MTRLGVDATALSVSRFALSPAFELESLLRVLQGYARQGPTTTWARRLFDAFTDLRADTDLDAVLALQSHGGGVDFLCPVPAGLTQHWQQDLAQIQATDIHVAREQVSRALSSRRPPPNPRTLRVLESHDFVTRLTSALDAAWNVLIARAWPAIRAICERDILHRAHVLCTSGWDTVLNELHPRLTWTDGAVHIDDGGTDSRRASGLLLVPSIFVAPSLAVHHAWHGTPGPQTLIFPARGSAGLDHEPTPDSGQLDALVGRARARLLHALSGAASTTHLARQLGMSPGAVGDHLAILLRAGMVSKARAGRSVVYQRSPLGDAVTAGTPGDRPADPYRTNA